MTQDERITALEAIIARYDAFFHFHTSPDGDRYVMTQGGFHICTNYWANQPRANGALFSVATDVHRFAAYIAKDANNDGVNVPGPAIYVENVRPGECNIGIQLEVANGQENLGLRVNSQHSVGGPNPGRSTSILVSDGGETRWLGIGPDGFTVMGQTFAVWLVRAVGSAFSQAKALWP